MHQKIAVLVWTIDVENNKRFLLRHNRPFNGYDDEWTLVFGNIEENEDRVVAAKREAIEEFSINTSDIIETTDLKYRTTFISKRHNMTEVHYFAIKVKDINVKISLNEESIGYDWMKLNKAKEIMKYPDESAILDKI